MMKRVVYLAVFFLISWGTGLAQDQFLGKPITEVKAQLDKKRIAYMEQQSPMGDQTTLSYSISETDPKLTDLFYTHSLSFQHPRNVCIQIISVPMLQKPWVADTIQNRLLASGYKKTADAQTVRLLADQRNSAATLEYIRDRQQPNVKMLRVVYELITKPTE